jgi:glycosyltransferase involved in cell wall biosynthesis
MKDLPGKELHLVRGSEGKIKKKNMKEFVHRMGIMGWIFFHGQVPPYHVRNHLLEDAVAVLPLTEDLISASFKSPLKLFEYMAAGVPIVAFDLLSTREILAEGENASMGKANDPCALAVGIQRLLEEPQLRQRLAQKASEDLALYAWDRRTEKVIHLLRSLKGENA